MKELDIFINDEDVNENDYIDESLIFDEEDTENFLENISEEDEKIEDEQIFKNQIDNFKSSLVLSPEELNKISSLSRERKFILDKASLLYNKEYFKKCEIFLNNYRFLMSVINSFKDDELIVYKIRKFLSSFRNLHEQLLILYSEYCKNSEYGKSSLKKKITNILILNDEKINLFIDELFSLGKIISQYSPDDEVGTM